MEAYIIYALCIVMWSMHLREEQKVWVQISPWNDANMDEITKVSLALGMVLRYENVGSLQQFAEYITIS